MIDSPMAKIALRRCPETTTEDCDGEPRQRWADLREWAEYEVGLAEARGQEQREDALATVEILDEHDRLRAALHHIATGGVAGPPAIDFADRVLAGDSIEQARDRESEAEVSDKLILAVVPEVCSGPGWSNRLVWVYEMPRGGGPIERRALQPEEWVKIPGLADMFDVGATCQGKLRQLVEDARG